MDGWLALQQSSDGTSGQLLDPPPAAARPLLPPCSPCRHPHQDLDHPHRHHQPGGCGAARRPPPPLTLLVPAPLLRPPAPCYLLPPRIAALPPSPPPPCTASCPHLYRTLDRTAGGATLLTHDLFTNDVLYLDVALDMRPLPRDLLPLVPLFCR